MGSVLPREIQPGVTLKIHVMPLVTQVTFVHSGKLEVRMKARQTKNPYSLELEPWQAVVTEQGTFFQLHNGGSETCHVLYIVSPAYMFHMVNDKVEYDDSIVLDEQWEELAHRHWSPIKLKEAQLSMVKLRKVSDCLAPGTTEIFS